MLNLPGNDDEVELTNVSIVSLLSKSMIPCVRSVRRSDGGVFVHDRCLIWEACSLRKVAA